MGVKRAGTFKTEYNKLKRIFKDLDADKLQLIDGLLITASFNFAEMERCIEILQDKGSVYEYINGKQKMIVKNPAFDVYSKCQSQYLATMKELRGYIKVDDVQGDSKLKNLNNMMGGVRAAKLKAVK